MHWILFANGHCEATPRIRALVTDASHVVGVDGGCRHLWAMDVLPHVAVGDMDSIPPDLLAIYHEQGISLYLHPPKKDATDLELALQLAFEAQATRITLLGATGGRLDHTLGNLFLLSRCLERGIPACVMDAEQSIYLTDAALNLRGRVGETISLIPVTPEVHGLTLTGLEYPLHEASLRFGTTWGMSNVFVCEEATVRLREGRILVFHLHGA